MSASLSICPVAAQWLPVGQVGSFNFCGWERWRIFREHLTGTRGEGRFSMFIYKVLVDFQKQEDLCRTHTDAARYIR